MREARVCDDGRNVAARTVSRQFFGTVAKPHFASTGAAQRPELAQEILAAGVLEVSCVLADGLSAKCLLAVHYGKLLAI